MNALRALVVALLVGVLVALGAFAPVAAAARVPKVALIVGPVGDTITARYKALANEAAGVARKAGAEVVKVYSPNATWPAVREAISDASIVIYLGHGNGWPSRYRSELFPSSQNGFGLNPVAGGDNSSHQYFGEAAVDNVKLAKNAVVLLHHLCYASGNTEPGLSEGTVEQAIQRVDNYAAGFIRAGASAVVAEAHMGPAWYVRQLLTGNGSIQSIWNRSPNANGHTFKVASERSRGYLARLDPDNRSSGFYRSLVARGGTTASDLQSGALGTISNAVATGVSPSLVGGGVGFGRTSIRGGPVAGAGGRLVLAADGLRGLATPLAIGARWTPLVLDAPATPDGTDPTVPPPPVELVTPEAPGTLVAPTRTKLGVRHLSTSLVYPALPGLYRLDPLLFDRDGVAYDAATQALLSPLIVRVTRPVAVVWATPASVVANPGMPVSIAVRVQNAGSEPWELPLEGGLLSRLPATLVASWAAPDAGWIPEPVEVTLDAAQVTPGGEQVIVIELVTPATPGDYLLVLDVRSPRIGSLAAAGSEPGLVRVVVRAR